MKHLALATATVLLAIVLGQTKTHYLAAVMLATIRSDWLQLRRHRRAEAVLATEPVPVRS